MKDEIKEILFKLRFASEWKGDFHSNYVIEQEKCKILLNYIINLQEENDILKRDIEAMKHNYNLLVRIIENGESMTQKFENGLTYQDYKSRNEKAIEYINKIKNIMPNSNRKDFAKLILLNYEDLLNILQGDENND